MKSERTVMLNAIKAVSISNLRDDWMVFSIDTMNPEEGDIVLECDFKTEFITHLLQRSGGRITVNVGPQFEFAKKKNKTGTIKFVKDDRAKTETYKSHVVTVPSGEPANSPSWPVAERKPVAPRPITTGKLIRRGGPQKTNASSGNRRPPTSNAASRAAPLAKSAVNSQRASIQAPVAAAASPVKRQAPPPAPPAPVATTPPPPPSKPMYKAIYNFESEDSGEVSFVKDDVMEVLEKDENGWWLAKKDGKEGWVPSNYLVEVPRPAPVAPTLPAKRQPPPPPPAAASSAPSSGSSSSAAPRHNVVSNGERASVAPTSNTNSLHAGFGGPGNIGGVPGWKVALEAKKAAAAAAAAGGGGAAAAPTAAARTSSPQAAARRPGPPAVAPKPSVGPKPTIPARGPAPAPKPAAAARPTNGGKTLQEIVSWQRKMTLTRKIYSAFLTLLFPPFFLNSWLHVVNRTRMIEEGEKIDKKFCT